MNTFESIIKKDIDVFDKKFKQELSTKSSLLYKITQYISRSSGKRIRPICVIMASGLIGQITDKTYRSAILVELLHTATLIHDDIVDDAQLRRKSLSINTVWKNKIAVLTGDYFLAKGLQLSVDNKDYDILNLISNVVQRIVEGELLQMEKTKKLNLKEDDYFSIIKLKTSSLFKCAFEVGGISAKANLTQMKKLGSLGIIIGNIFQIKDDILDYDQSYSSGKNFGNDIREGKINLPLLYAIKKMTILEKNSTYRILRKKINSQKEIGLIKKGVLKYNGIEQAENIMHKNYNQAIDLLQTFGENNYKKAVKLLLQFLMTRKK